MFKRKSKVYFPVLIILLLVVIGMFGYLLIEGFTLLESFYMTIITISTVGYREVHELSNAGKLFTSFLIITSFGTFAYAISTITRYIIDGEFNEYFKNYRLNTAIDKIADHVIVCGYGRNGRQAAHVLKNNGTRFVVIEGSQEIVNSINHKYADLVLAGDATQDDTLIKAGIKKAKALITTLPTDADNLFIVLSAKALNPELTIISRASDDNSDQKLITAGANNVIMPDKIGGAHMASLVTQPDIIEFIDILTGQVGEDMKLDEFTFDKLPLNLKDKTIRDLDIRSKSGANIIGFKTSSGDYIINPDPDTKIVPDSKLFVLGTSEQIAKLRNLLS